MDDKLEDIRKKMEAFGWGGLTEEQKVDVRFRLIMGESMKDVAARYKITTARVHEVKNGYR